MGASFLALAKSIYYLIFICSLQIRAWVPYGDDLSAGKTHADCFASWENIVWISCKRMYEKYPHPPQANMQKDHFRLTCERSRISGCFPKRELKAENGVDCKHKQ